MTKRNAGGWIIGAALLLSAAIWGLAWWSNRSTGPVYSSRVFETSQGWGYDILVNDSVLIHQEAVPVLGGGQGFARREWAEKASRIIINKMENGEHPRLTSFDLAQISEPDQLRYGKQGTTQ